VTLIFPIGKGDPYLLPARPLTAACRRSRVSWNSFRRCSGRRP